MNTEDEGRELAELRQSRDAWRRTAWAFAWNAERSRIEIERLRRRIVKLETEIKALRLICHHGKNR
jgi:hypothetical protein